MSLWNVQMKNIFMKHANVENGQAMKKYMKDRFLFYGIKTPERKELVRKVKSQYGEPLETQWSKVSKEAFYGKFPREIQYAIGDLLRPKAHNKISKTFLPTVEELIQVKSWWDTIDWLSPKIAGGILLRYPEEKERFPDQWIRSENKWLIRSALLFQLSYKNKMDTERLREYCLRHKKSQEFFVQKAMGWVLREYSKTNPKWVRDLLGKHEFPKLTVREGSKVL